MMDSTHLQCLCRGRIGQYCFKLSRSNHECAGVRGFCVGTLTDQILGYEVCERDNADGVRVRHSGRRM